MRNFSSVRRLLPVLLLATCSACTMLGKERYYVVDGSGATEHAADSWEYHGPAYELSLSDDESLRVSFEEYASYHVLWGPAIFCVVPVGLISWMWYDPLPESSISLTVLAEAASGPIEMTPKEMVLLLENGTELEPESCRNVEVHPYLHNDDKARTSMTLQFELPKEFPSYIEFSPGGIRVNGVERAYPVMIIRRAGGWKLYTSG